MTKAFYQNLDGVLLVFDVTEERSYHSLTKWLAQIKEIKPCPYVIAGNKADREEDRIVSDEQIADLEERFNTKCLLTSAKDG